jgi:hypothetical protein
MEIVAFVSFFALIVLMLIAPTGDDAAQPAPATSMRIGEAKA